jgi:hypothetical protein
MTYLMSTWLLLGQQSAADPSLPLSTLFAQAYASPDSAHNRFASFYARRFNLNANLVKTAAENMFNQTGDAQAAAIRDLFWLDQFSDSGYAQPTLLPGEARSGVAQAFADLVVRFANAE